MDEEINLGKKRLLVNISLITQNVIFEDIVDSLYSNIDAITTDDVIKLLKETSNVCKMRNLISILQDINNEDVYMWFHKALIDVDTIGCDEVANILEKKPLTTIDVHDSKEEMLRKGVITMSNHIMNISDKENTSPDIIFNKNLCSSANLAGESLNVFVPFVFKKKAKPDPLRDIPVYVGQSLNSQPSRMSAEYDKYRIAMDVLQSSFRTDELKELKSCIDNLLVYEIKGYEPVVLIAQQMFTNKCNIGLVLTWFKFWKMFVDSIVGSEKGVELFCQYIGFYLSTIPSYREWAKTGWDDLLKDAQKKSMLRRALKWLGMVLEVVHFVYTKCF